MYNPPKLNTVAKGKPNSLTTDLNTGTQKLIYIFLDESKILRSPLAYSQAQSCKTLPL